MPPVIKGGKERRGEEERESCLETQLMRAWFNKGSEPKSYVLKIRKPAINKGMQAQIYHANCNKHLEHIIQKEA
jgi:hypothetical protein